MIRLFALVVALFFMASTTFCFGAEITNGSGHSVEGVGQESSGGSSPVIDIHYPTGNTIDPREYKTPSRPTRQSNNESNKTSLNASVGLRLDINAFLFQMGSSVNGTGRHSDWSMVSNAAGVVAKQSSSTISGSLDLAKEVTLITDVSNTTTSSALDHAVSLTTRPTLLRVQNQVLFVGRGYQEKDCFTNMGDSIQDYYRAGAISKDSIYNALYMSKVTGPGNTPVAGTHYNKHTLYDINTRYTGTSRFTALFPNRNTSEVSQEYTGRMALQRRVFESESYDITNRYDTWLPCCNDLYTFDDVRY